MKEEKSVKTVANTTPEDRSSLNWTDTYCENNSWLSLPEEKELERYEYKSLGVSIHIVYIKPIRRFNGNVSVHIFVSTLDFHFHRPEVDILFFISGPHTPPT